MKVVVNNLKGLQPQSFIAKGKQRLKQHIDTVYLNNGDEFEIELYNPSQNKVLAKIELNGNSIGSGIILRPGERVFLERYINEAKKFLFETYVVNGNNDEVQQAIANNGDVHVKFYNEKLPTSNLTYYGSSSGTLTITPSTWTTYPNLYTYTTHNTLGNTPFTTTSMSNLNTSFTNNVNLNYSNTMDPHDGVPCSDFTSNGIDNNSMFTKKATSKTRHVETGRIEKGSDSDQSFVYDNTQFNSIPSTTNWWKIKPQSTKPIVKEELVTYCTECGAKRKKDTHKFCPHCGTKY